MSKKEKQNNYNIIEELDASIEKLIQKYFKEIKLSRQKKPKNALDFEWTSIFTSNDCIKFIIDMNDKKKFEYNPQTHEIIQYKNLNIPPFSIIKKNIDPSYNINEVHAKIIAISGVEEKIIQQIQLSGDIQKKFIENMCVFNHLRFKETYFQYKRSAFSLIAVIYEMVEENKIISEIKISSPIRVEARKKSYQDRLNTSSLLNPFLPDYIEKQYLVYKQGYKELMPIGQNIEGLLDYLKAQNIRHKPQELFKLIQKEIYRQMIQDQDDAQINLEKKLLIISLKDSDKESRNYRIGEKVINFMKFFKNSMLFFSQTSLIGLPHNFKQLNFTSEELKSGYKKAYNGMSSLKFEMVISEQINIQSHLSIQKKGRIPCDYKNDKEANDNLNNIPGPFHKSIFDLTIRNKELRSQATRIQARYEDFNQFTYELFENADSNKYGPSLIDDYPFKNLIQYNNKPMIQKTLERNQQQETYYESEQGTTKPSLSDSSNYRENNSTKDRNNDLNDDNNIIYVTNQQNTVQNKFLQYGKNKKEDLRNKKQRSKYNSDSQDYEDSEESSNNTDKKRSSNQRYLVKRKNNRQTNKHNNSKSLLKKLCSQNSKLYLDQYQSMQFQNNKNTSPDDKEDENLEEEEDDYDSDNNNQPYQIRNIEIKSDNQNKFELTQKQQEDI